MRDRNAYERNWSGEGRHSGRKDAGEQNQHKSETSNMNSHVPGIYLPQLVGSHRLCQAEGSDRRQHHHRCHNLKILPGNTGKASLGPVVKIGDVGIVCKRDDNIGGS